MELCSKYIELLGRRFIFRGVEHEQLFIFIIMDLGKLQQESIDYAHYEKVKAKLADLEQEKRELWSNSEKLFPEIQKILEVKIQRADEAKNWYDERNEILLNPNWTNVSEKDKTIIQFLASQLAQKLYSEKDESLIELRSILLRYS